MGIRLQALLPFESSDATGFRLSAGAEIEDVRIRLRYEISAESAHELGRLTLPRGGSSARSDRLWESTCFEAFLPDPGSTAYVEFNGAPDGRWNLYAFDDYRKGMRELATAVAPAQVADERTKKGVVIEWTVPLPAFRPERIGLTAVLVLDGRPTYWAVAHAGKVADFHLAAGFQYPLSGR
jgi:hypothetical protein